MNYFPFSLPTALKWRSIISTSNTKAGHAYVPTRYLLSEQYVEADTTSIKETGKILNHFVDQRVTSLKSKLFVRLPISFP